MALLDKLSAHLDNHPKNYIRAIFWDLSSAFNTIDQATRINIMTKHKIIAWAHNFLLQCIQTVHTSGVHSETIITSTGSPQGCVLSLVLFSFCVQKRLHLIKYADDTIILELRSGHWSNNNVLTIDINTHLLYLYLWSWQSMPPRL